jgi:UDP-N-acetylmuramate dehydrogenase
MIIQKDFPLSQILWYKIGGKTKYLLEAENSEDIKKALDFIEKNNIQKVFICGLGSNLIFTDDYFDGAVIRIVQTKKTDNSFQAKNEFATIFAGAVLDDVIQFSFNNNIIGLEWAGGLPGTIGAGVRGNVGAFGKEIKESLFSVEVLEIKNTGYSLRTIKKTDLHFSYRNSLIKENKNLIIVSTTFQLQPAAFEDVVKAKNTYMNNINYRKEHHPIEYPTCGSVFKNITDANQIQKILAIWPDIKESMDTKWHGKISMGYVVKRLGFSKYRVGNMQVSEKHANFIVNLGNAKASDVLTIIKEIQNKVQETFGFIPEVEVEIVSDTK